MGVKDLFSRGKFISRKRMRGNYRNDPVFQKEIMSNPEIAKALDRPEEQRKFHDLMMKKMKGGKLDFHGAQEIAYDIAHGKVDDISSTEGRKVAAAIIPDGSRRYKAAKSETTANPKKETNISSSAKSAKIPPAYFAYRAKAKPASTSPEEKNKYTSYFDAMKSVARNRGRKF